MGCHSLSRVSSQSISGWISCTGRWVLHHWVTREAHFNFTHILILLLAKNLLFSKYYPTSEVRDILGISKLKWTGTGEFNSDDHYIYYCARESLTRNGLAIMVNKRVQNAVLGCNLKNDRMISVHFQGNPFNITVIQVYAPASNAEEAEVERFYEDLQDLLELTPPSKKKIIR